MGKPRTTYKYHLLKGNKLVPRHPYGVTDDLKRRETELKQEFSGARVKKVGNRTTREGALRWELEQYKHRGHKGRSK